MKRTKFHEISPTETQEKWARVFFVCMFVTSYMYNFEKTMLTCVAIALRDENLS